MKATEKFAKIVRKMENKKNKKKKSFITKLIEWFQDGNDCENCEYCWCEKTSYEYDEYECGCYIKGDSYEDKRCYLINPIKFILGKLSQKKFNYYSSHQYDGYVEFMDDLDNKNSIMENLIKDKIIRDYVLCYKLNDEYRECNTDLIIQSNAWEVRDKYEDKVHPIKHEKLSNEWKTLIKKTFKQFHIKTIGRLKPYISK